MKDVIDSYNIKPVAYLAMKNIDLNFNKLYVLGYVVYLSLAYTHLEYFNIQFDLRNHLFGKDEVVIYNFAFILALFGTILGSLLASLIIKYSKRHRFILGNLIILLFSFPLYFNQPIFLISICCLLYRIGIGLVTPFYMKEIVPKSILLLTLVSM
jgi:hypothetical protein